MAPPPDEPVGPHEAPAEDLQVWFVEHGPALRRYFNRRAGGQEAEDLVQEVFTRLRARAATDAVDNVERYLFRIANNVLATRATRDAKGWRRRETLRDTLDPPDEISPERTLAGKQELALVIASVRKMPQRARQAFILHRFEEMTYAAIARRMGVSVSAVERLISRALDRIASDVRQRP